MYSVYVLSANITTFNLTSARLILLLQLLLSRYVPSTISKCAVSTTQREGSTFNSMLVEVDPRSPPPLRMAVRD